MKRSLTILSASLLLAAGAARADDVAGLPLDQEPVAAERVNLCEHKAVREIARIEKDLRPMKEIAGYITNPTGFAFKMVNDHVVHIPKWVGIAMDPRGYARAKVIDYVREEAKKAVGVENGCATEIAAQEAETA